MLISRSSWAPGVKKRTIERKITVGPVTVRFISVVVLSAAALFYLAQSTASATRGFRVSELEVRKDKLEKEVERLRLETVRLQSLKVLQESLPSLGLEPESR